MAGIDEYTKLLIQSDTTAGSTVFEDSSLSGHEITVGDGPVHSTDVSCPVGLSSVVKATSFGSLGLSASDDFVFGTSIEFVYEFFLYPLSLSAELRPMAGDVFFYTSGSFIYAGYVFSGSNVFVTVDGGGSKPATSLLTASAWNRVTLVRDSTSFRLYINKNLVAYNTYGGTRSIGRLVSLGFCEQGWNGPYYIQQLRISKGTNRGYTGTTITVADAPFTPESVPIVGSGTIDIPVITVDGTGGGFEGDPVNFGEATIPLITVDGAGSTGGSGSATVPVVRVSGTGGNRGAVTVPKVVVSGSGNVEITGTGQIIAPSVQVSGVGGNRGQAVIPTVQVSGLGLAALSGTGAVRIPTVQIAGSGVIEGKGIGSVSIPAIRVEGTGSHGIIGSGMVTVPIVRCNGRGIIASWQQVSAKLPRIKVRGTGTILARETNTGLINIPPATIFGRGDVEPTAETILQFMRP